MDEMPEAREPANDTTASEHDAHDALDEAAIAEAHALLAAIEEDLAAIEAALARVDARSYGTCEVCGAPIEPERLAANPTLRRCTAHPAGDGA